MIEPAGADVVLYLKSGRHYYARYEEDDGPRQLITAGGGGAFLHPTHDLPERIDAPGRRGRRLVPAGRRSIRRATTSKQLRKRIWLLPAYNLPLAAVFGAVQVLLAFMLGLHLDDRHVDLGFGDLPPRAVGEPDRLPADHARDRVVRGDGPPRPRRHRRRPGC